MLSFCCFFTSSPPQIHSPAGRHSSGPLLLNTKNRPLVTWSVDCRSTFYSPHPLLLSTRVCQHHHHSVHKSEQREFFVICIRGDAFYLPLSRVTIPLVSPVEACSSRDEIAQIAILETMSLAK